MAIDTNTEETKHHRTVHDAACDCRASGCACGCACCGGRAAGHAEHQNAIELLAQGPQTACDCGCCG